MCYTADIYFYRVGHGLFSYGKLSGKTNPNIFSWVYDCGSLRKKPIYSAINKHIATHGKYIDLLTISHFHKDHINGIKKLLGQVQVKTILIPYLPIWQRLLIGLYCRRYDPAYWSFLANPQAFFSEHAPDSTQIYIYKDDKDYYVNADYEDGFNGIEYLRRLPETRFIDELHNSTIYGLSSGKELIFRNVPSWIFIPYNEQLREMPLPDRFKQSAKELVDQLTNVSGTSTAESIFKSLKRQYRGITKNTNRTSLFLYGKPYCNYDHISCGKKGILYTGDGYLKTDAELKALEKVTGQLVNSVSCFQVMHHGSSYNWHRGLAAKIEPEHSLIGARRAPQMSPPYPDVLKDFSSYGLEVLDYGETPWHTSFSFC